MLNQEKYILKIMISIKTHVEDFFEMAFTSRPTENVFILYVCVLLPYSIVF